MKGILGNKIRTITCISCGEIVTRRMRPGTKYCSLACYRSSPRPQRRTGRQVSCHLCGILFYIPRNRKADTFFCSSKCHNTWQGRNKTPHACTICGKAFRWSPSRSKSYNVLYCSLKCRNADPIRREQLLRMNAMQQTMKNTRLERTGYALLDELGITYLPQHTIGGKFCVDAFSSEKGVVIQFDGDYWHGNPAKFPVLDARQQRRKKLDQSQDAYMRACGYTVLRFWETDVYKNTEQVRTILRLALTPKARTAAVPPSDRPVV